MFDLARPGRARNLTVRHACPVRAGRLLTSVRHPIQVLHVLDSLARGSVETTFLNVLRAWRGSAAMSHQVLALGDGPMRDDYAAVVPDLVVSPARASILSVLSRGFDVVHLLTDRSVLRLAPMLAGRGDAALVVGKSYDVAARFRIDRGRRLSWDDSAVAAADAVTFTTPQLAAEYSASPQRTTALRKAAMVGRFIGIPPAAESLPDRLLAITRLHPRHHIADLMPMLARVRARVPAADLRIAGGGSTHQQQLVMDAARHHGVDGAITLLGEQGDVAPLLGGARVFVMPSVPAGVPTVLLEAMAAGRPVVTVDAGHVDHVVTDGVEGFVVEQGNSDAMAARVIELLEDREKAARMGAAGRARALQHDVRVIASQMAVVFRAAARAHRRIG
jgi:glycosyltransferase involved in cell wall biosynthesis